jgi:hypothetical protein
MGRLQISGASPGRVQAEREAAIKRGRDPADIFTSSRPIVKATSQEQERFRARAERDFETGRIEGRPFFQTPAGFADTTTTPTAPITSISTAPSAPLQFVSPEDPPIFDVAMLGAEEAAQLGLSPQEQQTQNQSELLQRLQGGLVGEATFRAQEEERRGVSQLERTQQDLFTQLTQLKAEAATIPLQLEAGAAGRGITTTILGRQERALLRQNAIKALMVNSLFQATRGQLASALDGIDRAVAAQFDPVREQIAAVERNLEIVQVSPAFTAAEKRRAEATSERQRERKAEVDREEKAQDAIYKTAFEAAKSGRVDAVTLRSISNAETPNEALQIASEAGVFEKEEGVDTQVEIPTFDEFVTEFIQTPQGQELVQLLQVEKGGTFSPFVSSTQEMVRIVGEEIRPQFDEAVKEAQIEREPFTSSEKKKLEQEELLGATRKEKLDFLFGGDDALDFGDL